MSRKQKQNKNIKESSPSKIRALLKLLVEEFKGRKSEENLSAEMRRKASIARCEAKRTVDYIGYDLMYKNGISQVEEGLFSQTIEFSDISYQSARSETQKAISDALKVVYNSFRPNTSAQLTIANTPIPSDEVGNRCFFEKRGNAADDLVDEYNRILNDKMREGVSNLVRRRFLTYCVGANNIDESVPKLARIRNDISQELNQIRCNPTLLNGEDRLQVLNSILRPNKPFEFNWDKMSQSLGLHTKDFVAPGVLDFAPAGRADCFESDDTFGSVLSIRDFGSVLEDHYLASIIDLPIPLVASIHIQPIDKSDARALINRQLGWMQKEIIDEQITAAKKGYDLRLLPMELQLSKQDAEELMKFIHDEGENLFVYTGLIYTYANSLDELDRQVEQIISVARGNSLCVMPLKYRQRYALNSVLPLARNHVNVSRYLTTSQIVLQMPFASQELSQTGGGYYGQSKQSGNLVLCNRKKLASPMGFVCGKPGSGKSFSVKREVTNTSFAYPEDEIITFDPAGEYGNLCERLGGKNERLGPNSNACINPFDFTVSKDSTAEIQMAFKIDAFLALSSAMMAEGMQGLPDNDRSIITRCVGQAYENNQGIPILEDFYNELLLQPERNAADIALRYERFVKGPLSFFNKQTTIRFDSRITNIDLSTLPTNMRVFGMLTALEAVRIRMYENFDRGITTWLYIDEVQGLFGHPAIIDYFAKFWAEGRKSNLICTGITQNSTYMLAHESARNMVLNSDFCLLHKQSPVDRKSWVDMLALSKMETSYIDDAIKPGEGLLVAGGIRVPVMDDFPKGQLYDLFNTKPTEIAELKRKALFDANVKARQQDKNNA